MDLQGRVALVAGAGRGVGVAIARRLSQDGAFLVLAARNLDRLNAIVETLPGPALAIKADLTREEAAAEAVQATCDHFGGLQILVNAAGQAHPFSRLEDTDPASWHSILETGLTTAFLMSRAATPALIASGSAGRVINLSATSAKAASPGIAANAAAKAGLLGLTRSHAAEVGIHGVTVNALVLTLVADTPLATDFLSGGRPGDLTPTAEAFAGKSLLKRPIRAEEVASVAAFLASDHASAITGQSINVDGGTLVH